MPLQENAPLIGFAMASGVCIFFGNMGLMYSLCLAGVTIAVPLFSSFIVIVGKYKSLLCMSVDAQSLARTRLVISQHRVTAL